MSEVKLSYILLTPARTQLLIGTSISWIVDPARKPTVLNYCLMKLSAEAWIQPTVAGMSHWKVVWEHLQLGHIRHGKAIQKSHQMWMGGKKAMPSAQTQSVHVCNIYSILLTANGSLCKITSTECLKVVFISNILTICTSGTNKLIMKRMVWTFKLRAVPISIAGIALLRAKGLSEGPPARMTAWTDLLISSVAILEIFLRVCDRLSLGLGGFFSRSCCSSIWLVVASTACMMLQDNSETLTKRNRDKIVDPNFVLILWGMRLSIQVSDIVLCKISYVILKIGC